MNTELIEEVVLDQKKNLAQKSIGIKREVDIKKLIDTHQISVISGIRRCGKSTLLLQLMQQYESYNYLNFDDERLISFTVEDFRELMVIFKKYGNSKTVFFDEIQNIDKWERFIRRLYDEDYKIYITGSNSNLLSSELTTHLTGRYYKIELYPFSFTETLTYKNIEYNQLATDNKAAIIKTLEEYLYNGGFPEWIKYSDKEFLKRTYEDIIYKDLVARFKVRNIKQFKLLSQYLFTNITGELSYNSLKNALNIKSTNTVSEYISYLEESYLVFELFKYDFSLKKQYISNKKVFVIDNGIRNQISFSISDDKGKLLENLVFIELKRRQKELFFFKSKNNKEIDFIYNDSNIWHLVQVSYTLNDFKTKEREVNAIIEAQKEFDRIKPLIITYSDNEEVIEANGIEIQVLPVWKWLIR